jgi:adenylate kinase family enzyme
LGVDLTTGCRAEVRPVAYRRLVILGGPGSGKTTVAREAARRLKLVHYELDGLWWGPGWSPAGCGLFRSRVRHVLVQGSWVLDGNYFDEIAAEVWPQADLIVWLDLTRGRSVTRAVIRTASRVLGRKELWNGNRESLQNLTPYAILRLARRWPRYNARIGALLKELRLHSVVRLVNPEAVETWLRCLGTAPATQQGPFSTDLGQAGTEGHDRHRQTGPGQGMMGR